MRDESDVDTDVGFEEVFEEVFMDKISTEDTARLDKIFIPGDGNETKSEI